MAIPLILGGVVTAAVEMIKTWWTNREEIKRAEHDAKIETTKAETSARIEYLKTKQQMDGEWELESIRQSGWKDEWVTILVSIPLVLCFIPGMDTYVTRGFASLQNTPEWYQWSVLIVIASAFGVRKLVDLIGTFKSK